MTTQDIKEGFPLQWPLHWPRTEPDNREWSKFRCTLGRSRDGLLTEIKRLGGEYPIISSDLVLRRDGIPHASQRNPDDPGVAVYFMLFGKQQCIPCDKWRNISDNLRALEKTIDALRGIERWGAKEMVEAAFQGFTALPAPGDIVCDKFNYFSDCHSKEESTHKYKQLCKTLHPDHGGNIDEFNEMKQQYEQRL